MLIVKLEGKVALVTGAAHGIGKAISKLYVKEGAKIVINYNRSEKEASALAEELEKISKDILVVKADVSKVNEVKEMVQKTVERFGQIHILVNNAGILVPEVFVESKEDIWDKTIDINLKGAYLCAREVAPLMLKQEKGKIINISSICGLSEKSALKNTAYVASKTGMLGLTRSLAVNLGPKINVNAICPGMTDTEMLTSLGPERRKAGIEESLLKRIGKPEDIANAALFLASDDSDFMTGEFLTISGGRAMR
ncbi:3-oxoacyl-ACP reductase FabG [Candidatus Bathyarchaeota archaeon]|nr:3-oxoacyl-ACP reductase FabG [Candidatus Bathyarchaeota archaeon]